MQIEPSMSFQRGLPLLLVKQSTIKAGGIWGDAGPLAPFTPLIWFSETTTVDEFLKVWRGKKHYRTGQGKLEVGILFRLILNSNIHVMINT